VRSPSSSRPRSDAACFGLTAKLKAAIRRAPASLIKLGYDFNLTQPQISNALHDKPFGPKVRARFEALGNSLGIAAADCTRLARRRS